MASWSSSENLGGTIGTDSDILVARSTDNGATWTAPAALNTNATTDTWGDAFPEVTTDGAGNWVAVWTSSENLSGTIGTDDDIFVARSNSAPDSDGDGIPDLLETCVGGVGIEIVNPETGNTATGTSGSCAAGFTVASGRIRVDFPAGTQVQGGGLNHMEITFAPGPPPKLEISGADLPIGQTKTVEMPIGGGVRVCIEDKPGALIDTIGAAACLDPPATPPTCPSGEIGIGIPTAGQSVMVTTRTPGCEDTTYTVTNLGDTDVRIEGLVHTALATTSGSVGGIAELPEVARTPLETDGSSVPGARLLASVAVAGALVLASAAWYTRRRRL